MVFLLGLGFILWFQSIQVLFPFIIILFFIFLTTQSLRSYPLSYMDMGFGLLFLSEIATTLFSTDLSNSLSSLSRFLVLIILYVLFKACYQKIRAWSIIPALFFIFSSFLLVITILSFSSFYHTLSSEGFVDVNNFKNFYKPLKVVNNEIFNNLWASALLLFVPINLIFLHKQKHNLVKILIVLSLLLNLFCIVISFSRGVYLSLLIFVLLLNVFSFPLLKWRRLFVFNLITLILLSLSVLPVKRSFLTTASLNTTISQQRSILGRIKSWDHSKQFFLNKPIMGYGQDNFRLARENSLKAEEDFVFNDRANNTFIQLLVERGIVGFVCYFLFFYILVWIFYNNLGSDKRSKHEKLDIVILFTGLIAFLIRELTFSSFFDCDLVYFLAFYLLFGFIPFDIKIREINIPRKTVIIPFSLIVLSFYIFVYIKQYLMIHHNNQFVASYLENNQKNGLADIEKALSLSPEDADLLQHKAIALANKAFSIEISSKHDHLFSIRSANKEAIGKSLELLHRVLEQRPQNSEILHYTGWLYLVQDNREMAKLYFDRSLQPEPYESFYHIGFLFYNLKQSDFPEATENLS